jgi:hypothetical protein
MRLPRQTNFVRNLTVDDGHLPCGDNFKQPPGKLSRILFTPSLVRRAIKKLKVKTAGGPDAIPPAFFINCIVQRVVIDRFFSPVCPVISGVPQGPILGPIVFIIYINDISTVCCGDTALLLFADDAKPNSIPILP